MIPWQISFFARFLFLWSSFLQISTHLVVLNSNFCLLNSGRPSCSDWDPLPFFVIWKLPLRESNGDYGVHLVFLFSQRSQSCVASCWMSKIVASYIVSCLITVYIEWASPGPVTLSCYSRSPPDLLFMKVNMHC